MSEKNKILDRQVLDNKAESLITCLQDLITVMNKEDSILLGHDLKELDQVVREKVILTDRYESMTRQIKNLAGFPDNLSPAVRERLLNISHLHRQTTLYLGTRLELMIRATGEIIDDVIKSVKEANGTSPQYGNKKQYKANKAMTLSVDRSL